MLALVSAAEAPLSTRPDAAADPDLGDLSDQELIEAMGASRAQAAELAAVAELVRRRHAETARPVAVEMISPRDTTG